MGKETHAWLGQLVGVGWQSEGRITFGGVLKQILLLNMNLVKEKDADLFTEARKRLVVASRIL